MRKLIFAAVLMMTVCSCAARAGFPVVDVLSIKRTNCNPATPGFPVVDLLSVNPESTMEYGY